MGTDKEPICSTCGLELFMGSHLFRQAKKIVCCRRDYGTYKRCGTCRQIKQIKNFYANAATSDGYAPSCKTCTNEAIKKYTKTIKGRTTKIAALERRRARVIAGGENFTAKEFTDLCRQYGNQCLDCGSTTRKLTADHVTPLSKGGSNSIKNIQPLCKPCNSKKGGKVIDFRLNWRGA